MTKNWVASGLFGLALVSGVFAYPLNPMLRTIDNDGDSLTFQRIGDEHYQFARTKDGFLIIPDEKGIYYYADENGSITKIKAKDEKFRSSKDKKFLGKLDKKKSFKTHRQKNPDKHIRPNQGQKPQRAPWVPAGTEEYSSSDAAHPLLRLPSPGGHSSGTNRFPILLITTSGANNNLDSANFYSMLNADSYTTDRYTGSIKEYFKDQSNGKFVPTFDIYKVSVSGTLSSYKGNDKQLVADAINALKNIPGFDATGYDADNNGEVDMVGLLYSGTDDSGVGGYQYWLQWDGNGKISAGGKKFNTYFLVSQGTYPFPTFIHEFSHTMGLMDHYCTSDCAAQNGYPYPGAHAWDIMATGMYNNDGKTPAGYSAFERNFMGWMDYSTLSVSSNATTIAPLHSSNTAYKVPINGDSDEWFVLENRQNTKWDASLPYHGLLIWHIDYDQTKWDGNSLNNNPAHQNVDVVEAGSIMVSDYYAGFDASNLKDDPFPGSQKVTSYGPFTSWVGTSQNIQLYNITESGSNVCFATASGIDVGDCTLASSSSVAVSSSSAAVSSSSAAVSSSSETRSSSSVFSSSATAIFSSSSVTTYSSNSTWFESSSSNGEGDVTITAVYPQGRANLGIQGKTLYVNAATEGTKQVLLFDLQGNLLERHSFSGASAEIDLSRNGHGLRIARLSEGGKVTKSFRFTLK